MCKDCELKKREVGDKVECQVLDGMRSRMHSCAPSLIKVMVEA